MPHRRDTRKEHFERGEALATQAVALDDENADAHFAVFCNLGELLRLDGEKHHARCSRSAA